MQDGAELPPTFAWPPERLRFIIAGGEGALIASVEGAEDDVADAVKQIDDVRLSPHDGSKTRSRGNARQLGNRENDRWCVRAGFLGEMQDSLSMDANFRPGTGF